MPIIGTKVGRGFPSNTIVLDVEESHWYGICNKLDERQQFQELTRRA